jgi:arylsulfatase A-like enzyme
MDRKPNIVYILNDHQLYYRHGWDGGPRIRRPHFDRIAREGAVFTRAYASCPLCAPARRTMLTGLYPHRHGEIRNGSDHPFDTPTYLETLANEGYRNYYYGKWHAGPGKAQDFGCEGLCYPDYSNPYTKPEYDDYLRRRGLPKPYAIIERDFEKNALRKGERYDPYGPGLWECLSGVLQTPEDTHEAFYLANLACDRLRELASAPSGRPFSLRVDFWGPHQPYFPTQAYADLYDPSAISEYGSFRDSLQDKPAVLRRDKYQPMTGSNGELMVPNPLPWSEWQKSLALCYAHITMVDAAAGRILDTLDELGLGRNTLVLMTSDHGDAMACHGGHFDKRSYMPEEVLRVPLAMRFPGQIAAGQMRGELTGTVDLAPTMLDAAGTQFPAAVDGSSLLPLVTGPGAAWREDLLCETHGHFETHIGRSIITQRFKYSAHRDDKHELYDLETDPYEMTNLIDSPAHAATLQDMRDRLARLQAETFDPEGDLKQKATGTESD